MSHIPRVLVMMATYNGEQHLSEQIDSILAQEDVELTLRVCDDRSTDSTFSILQDYAKANNNLVVSQNDSNVGVGMNFMQMVYEESARDYDYYAFSDQDDIWLPNKLSDAISHISDCEKAILYYSDMTNYDDEHAWSGLSRYVKVIQHPDTVFVRNWAPGCTMLFNHSLFELLNRYQPESFPRLHDTWVHLVAYTCAEVIHDLDRSFIRRRITGNNVIGDLKDHHQNLTEALESFTGLFKKPDRDPTTVARQLMNGYGTLMSPKGLATTQYLLHYRDSLIRRAHAALRFDFWQPTINGRLLIRLCFLLGRY